MLELGRVGVRPEDLRLTENNSPPPVPQSKTGIYNTLQRQGQTGCEPVSGAVWNLGHSFGGVIPKAGTVQPDEGSRVGTSRNRPAVCAQDPSLRLKDGYGQDDARRMDGLTSNSSTNQLGFVRHSSRNPAKY